VDSKRLTWGLVAVVVAGGLLFPLFHFAKWMVHAGWAGIGASLYFGPAFLVAVVLLVILMVGARIASGARCQVLLLEFAASESRKYPIPFRSSRRRPTADCRRQPTADALPAAPPSPRSLAHSITAPTGAQNTGHQTPATGRRHGGLQLWLEVKAVRGYYIKRLKEDAAEAGGVAQPTGRPGEGNRRCLI
jgi:hypothetical protein